MRFPKEEEGRQLGFQPLLQHLLGVLRCSHVSVCRQVTTFYSMTRTWEYEAGNMQGYILDCVVQAQVEHELLLRPIVMVITTVLAECKKLWQSNTCATGPCKEARGKNCTVLLK